MIDEDLYQQAADELNTDKRRPHLWARACALASDDHDEARFLYTNLRVEELLAERENASNKPGASSIEEADQTLGLTPLDDTFAGEEIPSSVSSPAGVDAPDVSADGLSLEPLNSDAFDELSANEINDPLLNDPDADLMEDYVPENHELLDDTYASDEFADTEMEIDNSKIELDDTNKLDSSNTISSDFSQNNLSHSNDDLSATFDDEFHKDTAQLVDNIDLTQPSGEQALQGSIADLPGDNSALPESATDSALTVDGDSNNNDIETSEYSPANTHDLTQSNLDVLEAHNNELDSMLENKNQDQLGASEDEADWLDAPVEPADLPYTAREGREPLILEEDPLTDELSRQADELDIDRNSDDTADFSQQIAKQLAEDDRFPDRVPEAEANENLVSDLEDRFVESDQVSEHAESTHDASEPDTLPAAAAIAATSAVAAGATDFSNSHQHGSSDATEERELDSVGIEHTFPLDLTPGRSGKEYAIYRRDNQAQAVKKGVSWSALFLTLPYLLYRQLFGTALAYVALWIVAIGGLVLSVLAWMDAGADVTPVVQACTVGFGLLAFIGLLYLPFRYGNQWRANKLENRGFDLVARAKGRNPGRAIARARRHSALGS